MFYEFYVLKIFAKFSLKNFSKFIRKHLSQSYGFNKVAGWQDSQNLQEITCAGLSFSIKLLVEGATSASNHWCFCIFLLHWLWQNPNFLLYFSSVLLLKRQVIVYILPWRLPWGNFIDKAIQFNSFSCCDKYP